MLFGWIVDSNSEQQPSFPSAPEDRWAVSVQNLVSSSLETENLISMVEKRIKGETEVRSRCAWNFSASVYILVRRLCQCLVGMWVENAIKVKIEFVTFNFFKFIFLRLLKVDVNIMRGVGSCSWWRLGIICFHSTPSKWEWCSFWFLAS